MIADRYYYNQLKPEQKEIISADIYGDTAEIIEDCLYVIEPFMLEVMPEYREDKYYDYSNIEEMANIADEYLQTA